MRHSMSKNTAFNGETAPRHTFFVTTRSDCPLAIPESCAQNMGLRSLENHSLSNIAPCKEKQDSLVFWPDSIPWIPDSRY